MKEYAKTIVSESSRYVVSYSPHAPKEEYPLDRVDPGLPRLFDRPVVLFFHSLEGATEHYADILQEERDTGNVSNLAMSSVIKCAPDSSRGRREDEEDMWECRRNLTELNKTYPPMGG